MNRVFVFMGLLAMFSQVACHSEKTEKEEEVKYTVSSAVEIDTSFTKEYVSQIRSVRNIELRAMEKGYLEQILVDEGQFVRKGQLLFRIMPRMYQAELDKAMAEVRVAEIDVENSKNLADKQIVSNNELAMAKAKLEQAKAESAIARLHLNFTEVRAPFDGTIDRIPLKLGSLVDEGELLTSLSDNSQIFAYFNVSEPEYLDYQTHVANRADNHVHLLLANNELLPESGIMETIEGEFDHETGNIAFRARFNNPNKLLRNGETGKIQMTVPMKHALIIPQKATYEIQDKKYVFLVDKQGKVSSKEVKIAAVLPDLYVLSGGLSTSDKYLLEGLQKVKEDEQIKYSLVAPKDAISNLKMRTE
ncbi:efflux RND transporter periplasmic adaptor subunit [Sphingobacterium kyonggiense]